MEKKKGKRKKSINAQKLHRRIMAARRMQNEIIYYVPLPFAIRLSKNPPKQANVEHVKFVKINLFLQR